MIGQAPAMDGKSILPMLLGKVATVRTYTLQEGYQSCEAGHGEVSTTTCSRRHHDSDLISPLESTILKCSRRPSLETTVTRVDLHH